MQDAYADYEGKGNLFSILLSPPKILILYRFFRMNPPKNYWFWVYIYTICGVYMVSHKGRNNIKYQKIGIPQEMITEVKRIVDSDKRLGYVSIQEFVRESVRRSIVEYEGVLIENKNDK
jgi:hypothetical protein